MTAPGIERETAREIGKKIETGKKIRRRIETVEKEVIGKDQIATNLTSTVIPVGKAVEIPSEPASARGIGSVTEIVIEDAREIRTETTRGDERRNATTKTNTVTATASVSVIAVATVIATAVGIATARDAAIVATADPTAGTSTAPRVTESTTIKTKSCSSCNVK